MTEFDVVTVRGLRKTYGAGVVAGRLGFDVQRGEIVGLADADGAGKTTTVECIQGLRWPDGGVLGVLGYRPVTGAARLRPLTGSQLQDPALPDRLRVAEALDLSAILRARDGTRLLEQFGLGQRRRSGYCSLSGRNLRRLFLVLALRDCPRRTS
jgi:ABC-2 type transport system ATP-binding protein